MPKIIKLSKNLTKLWQKQFRPFSSETRCTYACNICNAVTAHIN